MVPIFAHSPSRCTPTSHSLPYYGDPPCRLRPVTLLHLPPVPGLVAEHPEGVRVGHRRPALWRPQYAAGERRRACVRPLPVSPREPHAGSCPAAFLHCHLGPLRPHVRLLLAHSGCPATRAASSREGRGGPGAHPTGASRSPLGQHPRLPRRHPNISPLMRRQPSSAPGPRTRTRTFDAGARIDAGEFFTCSVFVRHHDRKRLDVF